MVDQSGNVDVCLSHLHANFKLPGAPVDQPVSRNVFRANRLISPSSSAEGPPENRCLPPRRLLALKMGCLNDTMEVILPGVVVARLPVPALL